MRQDAILSIWTLFDSPLDMPGQFVLRRFEIVPGGSRPTAEFYASTDPNELRQLMIRRGLYCMPRDDRDEPHIVESWL